MKRPINKPRVGTRPRTNIEVATPRQRTRRDNVPAPEVVSLAAKVIGGYDPTRDEIETLAGSIMANAPKSKKGKA